MKLYWRHCAEVERDHKRDQRSYAHTYHYPGTICLCHAFWDLPKDYQDGLLLHEAGHILAGQRGTEEDANRAAESVFGGRIEYVDSPYGDDLERSMNPAARTYASAQDAIAADEDVIYSPVYVMPRQMEDYSSISGYDSIEVVYADRDAETVKYRGKAYVVQSRPYESGVNYVRAIFVARN